MSVVARGDGGHTGGTRASDGSVQGLGGIVNHSLHGLGAEIKHF